LISQVIFKEWCLVFHQTRYAVLSILGLIRN